MRSRTLEGMRWVSVLCLAGAALCFAQSARWERSVGRDSLVLPAPGPHASVTGYVSVWQPRARNLELLVPLAKAESGGSSDRERTPMPAALRVQFAHEGGATTTVDIDHFDFLSAIGQETIGLYSSPPFDLPESGHYVVRISAANDDLPAGRLLRLNIFNPGMGYFWVSDFTAGLGWFALAAGSALWLALAIARRYAPDDVPRR